MSYGFSCTNSSGIIQIDEDYANYCVYSSGTIANGAGTVTLPSIPGAVVFCCLDYPGLQWFSGNYDLYISNLVHIEYFYWNGTEAVTPYGAVGSDTNPVVTYYIMIPSNYSTVSTSTGFGLNVYKSDGSVSFSSNLPYMNILMAIPFDVTTWTFNTVPAPDTGKTRLVGLNSAQQYGYGNYYNNDTGAENSAIFNIAFSLSGNTLEIYNSYWDVQIIEQGLSAPDTDGTFFQMPGIRSAFVVEV